MMKHLFHEEGSQLRIDILADPEMQEFISGHASVLDSTFKDVTMSDNMRSRLQQSDYIFSGIKTFHELNEAFPSLLDENGERKTFERFYNDVRKIDSSYNRNYLRAEYNFCHASAGMAARWEQIQADGDRYLLQYRTAHDDKVREEHAALEGITLPPSDDFWKTYYPPNGWNCRCTAVQVHRSRYKETPHDEAMKRGLQVTGQDKKGIFQFNSGLQQKTFPDYNPYTISRCRDCDIAQGKLSLAYVPENELCAACQLLHKCAADRTKTEKTIERIHYLHEMEPLLEKECVKSTQQGETIRVGFSTIGNKHLLSDTYRRTEILQRQDLKNLDEILERATYLGGKSVPGHKHNIDYFHYFSAELHGRLIRLNVGREVKTGKSGQVKVRYYLYCVNDIKE